MNKLRMFGTFALATAVALVLFLGFGTLRSFAGPSYQELALLSNVLHLVRQHYVRDVDQRQLIEGAIKGVLSSLDPHTSYLPPELYKEVQLDTKGEFEGLGIEITKQAADGFVVVVAPIDGTPAQKAGIRAHDQITAVCPDSTEQSCVTTQEMNLLEAVKHMRGPRGSKVMVQVLREGWERPKPFVIQRASIRVSSVTARTVEKGIPYIRLSQFQERTAEELEESLDKAAEEAGGELRGLVLDLRDNPGGLLEQAVKVADLFLAEGMIVFSEGRGPGSRLEWHAEKDGTQPEYPIVVLVNGGSASASEIVAGALQDHKRGLLLGSETFGKGSVQTIIPLEDGSGLRLTTALYYLPSGRSIQEVRIQPDVAVDPLSEAELVAMEQGGEAPKPIGEEDLSRHLTKEETARAAEKAAADEPDEFARQLTRDRQLHHAVDLLKSWSIFSRLEPAGHS
jgi:carboxyl-terminal processing protease